MSLNIKSEEAHRLAQELARLTGPVQKVVILDDDATAAETETVLATQSEG